MLFNFVSNWINIASNKHRLSHATKMVLLFLQVNFPARALVIMSRQTLGWLCVQPSFE